MTLITPIEGIAILGLFAISMIWLVYFFSSKSSIDIDNFLVAKRSVSWLRGAASIAVSWMWAPAIFIVSLQAYTQGIAGAFWFIVPNILCFFIFAPAVLKLRKLFPKGYTFPEFIAKKFKSKSVHGAFLIIFFGYQLGAIIINALAGGTLLHILTGIDVKVAIIALSTIALIYSLLSGLKASIITDVAQMALILITSFILVPLVISSAGGIESVIAGFGGVTGEFGSIFNPWVAYSFGIAMTFGLISGPIGDQMFFQRGFAVKKSHIAKTFIVGGLMFGLVPILLSSLGFIAANPAIEINVIDPQMVGPLVIGHFLPKIALLFFVFMAFAGLASTLDSAYCAISSLATIDVYKKYINPTSTDAQQLSFARLAMLSMAALGTSIALLEPKLMWVFLIYGALASAGFFPTMFALFWKSIDSRTVLIAVISSIIIGLPLSIYANVVGNVHFIVLSAIASVLIGLLVCLSSILTRATFISRTTRLKNDA